MKYFLVTSSQSPKLRIFFSFSLILFSLITTSFSVSFASEIPLSQSNEGQNVNSSTFLIPQVENNSVTKSTQLNVIAQWNMNLRSSPFDSTNKTINTLQNTIQYQQPIYQTTQIINNYPSVLQGSTPVKFEVTNPTQTRTITIPNASGEVSLLGQSISGSEIDNNTIELGTKTTGDYVKSAGGGNGISVSGAGTNASVSVNLSDLSSDWTQTGAHDIILNNTNSELKILSSNGTHYAILDAGSLNIDTTLLLSGASGTVLTSTNYNSFISSGLGDLVSTNNLSDLLNTSTARTNLGLGSIATQLSNNISITGGTINGVTLTSPTINGTIATVGLTLPAVTIAGNITGLGSPTLSGLGSINGLTLSSSSLQPVSAGGLTIQSNGANTLTFDTGSASTISIGATNATTLIVGNSTSTLNLNGATTLAANKNLALASGTGTITQNYVNTTGNATTINATDNSSSGVSTMKGLSFNLTGGVTSGSNTLTAISLESVSSVASNIFNGITFGSNLSNFLTSPSLNINGSGVITGAASINGLTLSSSSLQPVSAGSLTIQSNGANALTLDTGAGASLNLGSTNATTLVLGNASAATSITGNTWSVANTGALVLSPTAASTTALTVNGTTNTTPADAVDINLLHTGGTATNGLKLNINGAGGTTTNALNITQTTGTITNGLVFGGTIGTDIGAIGTNRGLSIKANGVGTLALDTTGAGTIQIGNTNATTLTVGNALSTLNLGGNFDQSASTGTFKTGTGAITLNGATTIASGKILAITSADSLTVGGVVIPQILAIPVPLTAAVITQPIFIADANYQLVGARCLPTVAAGLLGTLQITIDTLTAAVGTGTTQLTGTINLSGVANTVVSGTVIGSPTTIAIGDRISTVFGGTLTGLLGTCTIYIKRVL